MADASLSKSAKQRLAKKARDEKAAADAAAAQPAEAPPAPAPAPAPAAAKAKALPKGYPVDPAKPPAKAPAAPAAPAPAAAKKAAAPAPAASNDGWTEASVKSKSKNNKGKASPAVAPAPSPAEPEDPLIVYDDGTGADWEVCKTAVNKKKDRQTEKHKAEELKKADDEKAEYQAAKDAAYRAKKAEKKAAKNGTTGAAEPAHVVEEDSSYKAPPAGERKVRPDVQAKIAKVAAEAKAAAAKAAAGQAARAKAAPAAAKPAAEEAPAEPDNSISIEVQVPEEKIGVVIGPKGARIREIEEKTGVLINTAKSTFTIKGEPEKVPAAEKAIKDLITKGYMEMSWDDFTEASLMIYSSSVPDLIGKGGETIRHIKEKLNVEINVQKPPGGGAPKSSKGQKVKVDIAGSADGVAKCKDCISSIMMFHHHEITHPCAVHAEVDVPSWGNALIIGKGGGELRHIQNNYVVKVYLPREGETDNKHVVIVGSTADVNNAKTYIEKKLKDSEAEYNDPAKKKPSKEEDW